MEKDKVKKNKKTPKVDSRPASNGMEAKIYNQDGKESGSITLPEGVFGARKNADLVHQVILSLQSNRRSGTAHSKGRGEVRGGGKKPWQQKGTGRARHGSRRSPIWRGGGVTHGPTNERVYDKKITKSMGLKTLAVLLSEKLREGRIIFVEDVVLNGSKTKEAAKVMEGLSKIPGFSTIRTKKPKNILISIPKKDPKLERGFKNLPYLSLGETRNLNPLDLYEYRYLALVNPKEGVAVLQSRIKR